MLNQKDNKSKPVYRPEHFPRGTEIIVKFQDQSELSLIVDKVEKRGPDQFGIYANLYGTPVFILDTWIKTIVRRGTAGMVWFNGYSQRESLQFFTNQTRATRSRYAVYVLTPLIIHLLPSEYNYDLNRFQDALSAETFVKTVTYPQIDVYMSYYEINKKRLKRWVQQNKNRFLLPNKAVRYGLNARMEKRREILEHYADTFPAYFPVIPDSSCVKE